MIYLVGYTNKSHTNWYPWYFLNRLFNELGFKSKHLEEKDIEPKDVNYPRINPWASLKKLV